MNKYLKWIIVPLVLIFSVTTCLQDRNIENGMTMQQVRELINQNFSDLLDSVSYHTTRINYIVNNPPEAPDLSSFTDSISHLRTAVNAATNNLISIDTRTDGLEAVEHSHTNDAILDATTASFTTALSAGITHSNRSILDATTASFTTALSTGITHSNRSILDATTSSFTTAQATALSTATTNISNLATSITTSSLTATTLHATGNTTLDGTLTFSAYNRTGQDSLGFYLVNGRVDTLTLVRAVPAEWAMKDHLKPFVFTVVDWVKNGDLDWKYKDVNGNMLTSRKLEQGYEHEQLQAEIEHNTRYDFRLRIFIFLLLGLGVYNFIVNYKLKKKLALLILKNKGKSK
jgi:hypothetical protein